MKYDGKYNEDEQYLRDIYPITLKVFFSPQRIEDTSCNFQLTYNAFCINKIDV